MRGGRTLLLLLVVAVGLGAYIYFVESKRDPAATESRARLFDFESGAIDRIELRPASGEASILEKSGDGWRLIAPVTAPADSAAASSIADALATTEIVSVLEENPSSLEQFGLQPARLSVVFRKAGDATEHRLNIGRKTPVGSEVYAQVAGQPRLVLLGSFIEDTLNRTAFDLRDKTVLAFQRDAVDRITIERPSARLELAREGGDWTLTAPITARADTSPIDSLISRIEQARMSAIAHEGSEPSPAQLKTFGLERPQLVATLGSGSTRAALAIGAEKDATSVYARDLSRPIVFTVEKSLLTDLQKQPSDLRVKDVFEFQSYTATGLDVTYGGTSVSYAKQTSTGDAAAPEVWRQTKPDARDVNATAMADLLNTLSSMRADSFMDRVPGAGDDMAVVARFGDAAAPSEERVTLRKAGTTVYAIRPNDPGAAVVPTADFDKAITQLKALTDAK